jgi:hypothetical protein
MRDTALRDIDRELDAPAVNDDGEAIAVASCKWTAGEMPASEWDKLKALAAHLRPTGDPPSLFLFSRSGFEEPLREAAATEPRLRLVTPEEMRT